MKIDWKSKFADLAIVIIGITIAFKLNNWNESKKSYSEAGNYITGFREESAENESQLQEAIKFTESNRKSVDTLKQMLLNGNYEIDRIKVLTANMLSLSDFNPTITTMDNIAASGEFNLINDLELRKLLVKTYNSYNSSQQFEDMLKDYVEEYVTPFMFKHIRFSDFSSITGGFEKDPAFENIVIGYLILIDQKINAYHSNLEQLTGLNKRLNEVR